MAACVERNAACGASYNACASGATPCKFETPEPARPAVKATADRQFQRRVSPPFLESHSIGAGDSTIPPILQYKRSSASRAEGGVLRQRHRSDAPIRSFAPTQVSK